METMVSRKVFFLLYQGNIFGKCQNERSGSYHLFQSLSVGSLHETDHSKIFALFCYPLSGRKMHLYPRASIANL